MKREEDGSLWSWMDHKNTYKSLEEFKKAANEEFEGESVFCAFCLSDEDFPKPEEKALFDLLSVFERATFDSKRLSDYCPVRLLEAVVNRVLAQVRKMSEPIPGDDPALQIFDEKTGTLLGTARRSEIIGAHLQGNWYPILSFRDRQYACTVQERDGNNVIVVYSDRSPY